MYAEINGDKLVTWPYDYDTLIRGNPNTSFPNEFKMPDVYPVTQGAQAGNTLVEVTTAAMPNFDATTQTVEQATQPQLVNGKWTLSWNVVTLTAEQQQAKKNQFAASVRNQRNQKLADSDWTQLADSQVNKSAWGTYRQALRDVPKQSGFPWEVTWPNIP